MLDADVYNPQSILLQSYNEFHEDGTMKDSPYRDRVIDVMEELSSHYQRDKVDYLTDRHSERKEKTDAQVSVASSALKLTLGRRK